MAIKYPNTTSKETKASLFYPSNEKGMLLVEVVRDRRQKVVKIPPFLDKPSPELLTTINGESVTLKKPKGRHYLYRSPGGLMLHKIPEFKKVTAGWFNPDEELPYKPKEFPVMGNYAKMIRVCVSSDVVCEYIVVARTMANDIAQLNRGFLKTPQQVTVCYIAGDKEYLPVGFDIMDLSDYKGWVCDGFYFTGKKINIEPNVFPVTPIEISSSWGETHFKLPNKSGRWSVASDNFENLRFVGYRCASGLHKKVTSESFYI